MQIPKVTSIRIEVTYLEKLIFFFKKFFQNFFEFFYHPHWSVWLLFPNITENSVFIKWISPLEKNCLLASRKNIFQILLGCSMFLFTHYLFGLLYLSLQSRLVFPCRSGLQFPPFRTDDKSLNHFQPFFYFSFYFFFVLNNYYFINQIFFGNFFFAFFLIFFVWVKFQLKVRRWQETHMHFVAFFRLFGLVF